MSNSNWVEPAVAPAEVKALVETVGSVTVPDAEPPFSLTVQVDPVIAPEKVIVPSEACAAKGKANREAAAIILILEGIFMTSPLSECPIIS